MKIANLQNRLVVIDGERAIDVERASEGRFPADPQAIYEHWDEFAQWTPPAVGQPYDAALLGAPVPRPRQVFALGLNYAMHAREAGLELPPMPLVFTKFQSCLVGPSASVEVATEKVDWEVELVAVIGARAYRVEDGWAHVAGLTVGQDISARDVQSIGSPPQFSLGKSFPGFGPTGPWVETQRSDDLAISCAVNGETVQSDRTSSMLFGVDEIVKRLSAICPLLPGDLIFTGTPAGVGNRMDPPRYLKAGDVLTSTIESIGTITTRFV